MNMPFAQVLLRTPQFLVQTTEGGAAVPGNESAGIQARAPVPIVLI